MRSVEIGMLIASRTRRRAVAGGEAAVGGVVAEICPSADGEPRWWVVDPQDLATATICPDELDPDCCWAEPDELCRTWRRMADRIGNEHLGMRRRGPARPWERRWAEAIARLAAAALPEDHRRPGVSARRRPAPVNTAALVD